jgi:apolipoprotein N-acyltransferase
MPSNLKLYFDRIQTRPRVSRGPVRWQFVLMGGLLMGLAPDPVNAWLLAWGAIAPLWLAVTGAASRRTALFYGFVWGIAYNGLALAWIRGLHPLTWMGVPWLSSVIITLFCWGFITVWGGLRVAFWAVLFHWFCPANPETRLSPVAAALLRVLVGIALWCGSEALWAYGPLDWTAIAYTQSPQNLWILHLGQLAGPATVAAAIVAVNGLLAEAWRRRTAGSQRWHVFAPAFGLFLTFHLFGLLLFLQPTADRPTEAVKVGIVQGNVPTRIKLFEEGVRLALTRYVQGYETLVNQGVQAVLMPEGSFPWLWLGRPKQAENQLYQAVLERQIPVWIGTIGTRQGRITQTLFSLGSGGETIGRYDKIKLVPLGEYVPFETVLGHLVGRLSPVEASMVPGLPNQRFETPFGRSIAAICFDSAFAWVFRDQARAGGQFIVTASNNDPYDATLMAQHQAHDVMRAIETDRWAVRATNTGFSGVVNPHGQIQWHSGFRTYETHAHVIYRRQSQTLYVRWGDWLTPLLLASGAIGLIYSRWESDRNLKDERGGE